MMQQSNCTDPGGRSKGGGDSEILCEVYSLSLVRRILFLNPAGFGSEGVVSVRSVLTLPDIQGSDRRIGTDKYRQAPIRCISCSDTIFATICMKKCPVTADSPPFDAFFMQYSRNFLICMIFAELSCIFPCGKFYIMKLHFFPMKLKAVLPSVDKAHIMV